MKKENSFIKLWGQPLLLGLLILSGLILALVGDGIYDWIACICLLYPLIRLSYFYWTPSGKYRRIPGGTDATTPVRAFNPLAEQTDR